MTSERISIVPAIRLAPKHMLAIPVFLTVALVFGKEFEGVIGWRLAGLQLVVAVVACMMYMLSMVMFVVMRAFERNTTDDRGQKLLLSLRIKPLYFQQFISAFAFFGRSLFLAAPEFVLLTTVFPSMVPRKELGFPVFIFCLLPLFALCHLVVEWMSTSGFLDCIDRDRKQEAITTPVEEDDDRDQ
jgi:hypothetical protein